MIYYKLLQERGYKFNELYDMTLKELRETLRNVNKGLAYSLYQSALLTGLAFCGKLPKSPEEAMPELYPPKKTYKMPDWMKRKYLKKKGVEFNG